MAPRRTPFQRLRGASVHSTPATEVRFWALIFAVLTGAVYGWYAPEFEAHVGVPVISCDGTVGPAETLGVMAAYGSAGRRAYVAFLSLACLLPVAGSLLLLRLYEAVADPLQWRQRALRRLVLVAVLPALCDLVENTLHALMAMLYPQAGTLLASLAYGVTVAKLLSFAGALLTLAVLASMWLRRRVDADPHQTL